MLIHLIQNSDDVMMLLGIFLAYKSFDNVL